ncbi:conserved hypothetical protein [Novosphingobium sp. 9U]|nr:conserved hypothetical protein [Novosphingobium sp. 9U]
MVLKRILCLFNKHTPKRSTTQWDGVNYVGDCRHCRRRIRRFSRGNWKTDQRIASAAAPIQSVAPTSSVTSSGPHSSS